MPEKKEKNAKAKLLQERLRQIRSEPTGTSLLINSDGILLSYDYDSDLFLGDRLRNRIIAEQGWFEKLTTHAPSVGSFYEDILRAIIREYLPSKFKVGTGFIFDTRTRKCSKQIDILVYDDQSRAPLFGRDDFVVITPEMAISVAEVKKTLTTKDVRDIVRSTIFSNLGTDGHLVHGLGAINVFSYNSRMKISSLERLVKKEICELSSWWRVSYKGKAGSVGIEHIALPSFYFLHDNEIVVMTLKIETEGKNANQAIFLEVLEASGQSGVNDFISKMTKNRGRPGTRDFISHQFNKIVREEKIAPVFLMRRLDMAAILDMFPGDKSEIQAFRCDGRRPYACTFQSTFDLQAAKTFHEFIKSEQVGWECHDENVASPVDDPA